MKSILHRATPFLALFLCALQCANGGTADRKIERLIVKTEEGWRLDVGHGVGILCRGASVLNCAESAGFSTQRVFEALLPEIDFTPRSAEEAMQARIAAGMSITVWYVGSTEKEAYPLKGSRALREIIDAAATNWQQASPSTFSDLLVKFPIFPSWQPSASRGNRVKDRFFSAEKSE